MTAKHLTHLFKSTLLASVIVLAVTVHSSLATCVPQDPSTTPRSVVPTTVSTLQAQAPPTDAHSQPHVPQGWHVPTPPHPSQEPRVTVTLWLRPQHGDRLEQQLMAVSDPASPQYGKHLSDAEVATLVAPPLGAQEAVEAFAAQFCGTVEEAAVFGTAVRLSFPAATAAEALGTPLLHARHNSTNQDSTFVWDPRYPIYLPTTVARHVQVASGIAPPIGRTAAWEGAPRVKRAGAKRQPQQHRQPAPEGWEPRVLCYGGIGNITCDMYLVCSTGFETFGPCSEPAIASVTFTVPDAAPIVWTGEEFAALCKPCNEFVAPQMCGEQDGKWFMMCRLHAPIQAPIPAALRPQAAVVFDDGTLIVHKDLYYSNYDVPLLATPGPLRELYRIPSGTVVTNDTIIQALVELPTTDSKGTPIMQSFSRPDLEAFEKAFADPPFDPADAQVAMGSEDNTTIGSEASLDIQVIMGIAPGATTKFYYNPQVTTSFFGNLLEVLGNISSAGSGKPQVVSISYYGDCTEATFAVLNTLTQTLGAQGVTVLICSGDEGVRNFGTCQDIGINDMASLPYVTSVGATVPQWQGPQGDRTIVEGVCSSDAGSSITSGGGFGRYATMPAYQQAAVKEYLASGAMMPQHNSSSVWNTTMRAYPDVSALGHGYATIQHSVMEVMDGTSASTPAVAAMVTLLNNALVNAGKPWLGFINPLLYSLYAKGGTEYFSDITLGTNACGEDNGGPIPCCSTGFGAAKGYDAATGLGIPIYAALEKEVLSS